MDIVRRNYEFIITNHLRERFVERFSEENRKKYAHMKTCQGCPRCVSLVYKLREEVRVNRGFLDKVICARLFRAKETKVYMNDSNFMAHIHNKYGYEKFQFLVDEDILFVVIHAEKGKVAVTCMDSSEHPAIRNLVRRPKYVKKEKSEALV